MKTIEVIVSSTPENPEYGYGDHITVFEDGKTLFGSHCSSCPNPYNATSKKKYTECYGWIASGDYQYLYYHSKKYGPCLLINDGKKVASRIPNVNHGGKSILTEVLIHAGGHKCRNADWRGSAGCITIHREIYSGFISNFKPGDKGVLTVKDFIKNVPKKKDVDKMNILKKLDGKKTIIGALIFVALFVLKTTTGIEVPQVGYPESWGDLLKMAPEMFAGAITIIGLLHKIFKR